jgi:hypothetical protein
MEASHANFALCIAFSREVDAGSRQENASKQEFARTVEFAVFMTHSGRPKQWLAYQREAAIR